MLGCNPTQQAIDAAIGPVTATTTCPISPVVTITESNLPVTTNGCTSFQIRGFNATDECGNSAFIYVKLIWTNDVNAPIISADNPIPSPIDLGCNPYGSDIETALGQATATDECSCLTIIPTYTDDVTNNGCSNSKTRTWTASDTCGNTSTLSRTVTWSDDTNGPVIIFTIPEILNGNLGCNPSQTAINEYLDATASDDCNLASFTYSDSEVDTGCGIALTRTWMATDECGHETVVSRTATWITDNSGPIVTFDHNPIFNGNLGCNPTQAAIDDYLHATSGDGCSNLASFDYVDQTMVDGCTTTLLRTWTAIDACGNVTSASRTATWTNPSTPVLHAIGTPSNGVISTCNPSQTIINNALGLASVTDTCDPNVAIYYLDSAITGTCTKSQTRTWTATNACGFSAVPISRTVTWKSNTTPPTISLTKGPSGSITNIGCNPLSAAIITAFGTATATDNCGGSATVTLVDSAITGPTCSKSQTRTWTATDSCGNTATATKTITWNADITGPVITAIGTPSNGTIITCNPNATAIENALGSATVTDTCDGGVTASYSDSSVTTTGCSKSQTRTWTATDACGNITTVTRTATWTSDTTGPTITIAGYTATVSGCNPTNTQINTAFGTASATDNCNSGANITITSSDSSASTTGCSNSKTRTWTATDLCGNKATTSKTVTWTIDTTGPIITATGTPSNGVIVGCNPSNATITAALGSATATDDCSSGANITLTAADSAVTTSGCTSSQTRTWTATDACGNVSTSSRMASWTTANCTTCAAVTTSNSSSFNSTAITNGNYIWFSSVAKITSTVPTAGLILNFTGQTITFTANSVAYTLPVPDSQITYNSSYTSGTTTYAGGQWTTKTPASFTNNVFLSGLAYKLPVNFPGSLTPVVWNGTLAASAACTVQWRWSGAVYTQFSTTYSALGVKPLLSATLDSYNNADQAGAPEGTNPTTSLPWKNYLIAGAKGNGGTSYTGTYATAVTTSVTCTTSCENAGCTLSFWINNAGIWNQNTDATPKLTGFITTTNFWTYFGLTPGLCSLPTTLSMLTALSLPSGGCNELARQAVAALMSAVTFSSTYKFPSGTSDFATLKAAIITAFSGGCNCSTLAASLVLANSYEVNGSGSNVCNTYFGINNNNGLLISATPINSKGSTSPSSRGTSPSQNSWKANTKPSIVAVATAEMPKRRFLPKNN